jgi:hypothetical protein
LHHWQDDKWLAQMRRELPANQYLRMIENRFTSSEAAFITMGKWDPCVRPELGHVECWRIRFNQMARNSRRAGGGSSLRTGMASFSAGPRQDLVWGAFGAA